MIDDLLEGDWLVVEIDGEPIDPEAPREVRFEGDRVAGRVGVNRFTGQFTIEGDIVHIGTVASTRMAGPPELMDLESRFNSHLEGEHQSAINAGVLTLDRDEHSMVLARAPSLRGPFGDPG